MSGASPASAMIKSTDDRAHRDRLIRISHEADAAYVADGVPLIRGDDISDTRRSSTTSSSVSRRRADEPRACNVSPGDLVFQHRGRHRASVDRSDDRRGRYVLFDQLDELTCNQEVVDPLFVFYFF